MKTIINLPLTLLLFTFLNTTAQQGATQEQTIKTYPLEITYSKTSSIIFPSVIKSVDRGSKDLLVQKAAGVGNVLQVKAGRPNFAQTNLTVITADGHLHHFTVDYSTEPSTLTVDVNEAGINQSPPSNNLIFQTEMTEADMETHSSRITRAKKNLKFHSTGKYKIQLAAKGIYIKDNVMFFHLSMANKSNIKYDVEFLRFYVRDKSTVKRTASQELNLKPIYIHGNPSPIPGRSTVEVVYAFEKFTIPEAKTLNIELFEKNGGRNLMLSIKNKTIVNAKPAP